MQVPIAFEGNLCVGGTVILLACCPSDTDVVWTIEEGQQNVTGTPLGDILILQVIRDGGFKIKAECCREYEPPWSIAANG